MLRPDKIIRHVVAGQERVVMCFQIPSWMWGHYARNGGALRAVRDSVPDGFVVTRQEDPMALSDFTAAGPAAAWDAQERGEWSGWAI